MSEDIAYRNELGRRRISQRDGNGRIRQQRKEEAILKEKKKIPSNTKKRANNVLHKSIKSIF